MMRSGARAKDRDKETATQKNYCALCFLVEAHVCVYRMFESLQPLHSFPFFFCENARAGVCQLENTSGVQHGIGRETF